MWQLGDVHLSPRHMYVTFNNVICFHSVLTPLQLSNMFSAPQRFSLGPEMIWLSWVNIPLCSVWRDKTTDVTVCQKAMDLSFSHGVCQSLTSILYITSQFLWLLERFLELPPTTTFNHLYKSLPSYRTHIRIPAWIRLEITSCSLN